MFGAILLNILQSTAWAAPEEPSWWVGLPVASVALVAPSGGLPDENLQPLLRSRQGRVATVLDVRADVATLYRVGSFSSVEARVDPWLTFDASGEEVWGVHLRYVVSPAPVLARIRIQGNREFRDRQLLDASGLATGQVFYEGLDRDYVATRVREWLAARGYPSASVEIRTSEPSPGRVYLVLLVQEGPADIVAHLGFAGPWERTGVPERKLVRWVRRAGVKVNRPLGPDAVPAAQDLLRERLGSMRGGVFRRARGFTAARVTPAVVREQDGIHVTFAIEPGPRLVLDVAGMGLRGRWATRAALEIDHRLRLTGGYLDRAPDLARAWLQEHGWLDAKVSVALEGERTDPSRTLVVRARRGSRHTIGDVPDFRFRDFTFDFEDADDEAVEKRLGRDLQAVFDQASNEILRREYYTEEAMEVGREAAKGFLEGQGYLESEVEVRAPVITDRQTLANAVRSVLSAPRRKRVDPQVGVRLGPVTTLAHLEIEGLASDVEIPWLEQAYDERIGAPFSPQRAEALARRLVDAHRAEGYVEADATVTHSEVGPHARQTFIVVEPGPQVRLRSVVTRNRRLTRRAVVARTVDLELGELVRLVTRPGDPNRRDAPRTLEEVRADLYDLGVFRTVSLELVGDGEARDLVVNVNERPRTSVELGGGASTDQGVRAFLRFNQRNLFGLAHHFQAVGQLGLDYRSDVPDVARLEGRAAASYTAPRFPGAHQQLTFDVTFRERRQERTLRIDRSGGGATIQASFGRRGRTGLTAGARVEARQLNQFDAAAALPSEAWSPLLAAEELATRPPLRWQEGVSALLLHDLRNDPIRPTQGALFSLSAEWVPGLPWPDQPRTAYLKAEGRVQGSVPLGAFTLRIAGGGGRLLALTPTVAPVEDRYRLGGTGSLRGFVRDGVGPHNTANRDPADWPGGIGPIIDYATRNDPQRWVPTGGDTVADGTVELIAPLPALGATAWEGYAATVFADFGNVWFLSPYGTGDPPAGTSAESERQPTSNQPQYLPDLPFLRIGVGVGARVETPVGPLQFDVAFNPQALAARRGTGRYDILRRGWEEPGVRFHLTLGSLF